MNLKQIKDVMETAENYSELSEAIKAKDKRRKEGKGYEFWSKETQAKWDALSQDEKDVAGNNGDSDTEESILEFMESVDNGEDAADLSEHFNDY